MKKTLALLAVLALGLSAYAQTTPLASWPECKLGKAPVAPGPAPTESTVFKVKGGPVIMSEAGVAGAVRLVRCKLSVSTPSYRGGDGVLRDVASNQPYWPVGWDAAPPIPAPTPAPAPPATPATLAVTGVPSDIAVRVDGSVDIRVHHDGEVKVVHSGKVDWQYIPTERTDKKKASRCGKKCALVIGFVAAAAVGGTYVATHKGRPAAIPTTPTAPTGSLLPIVTTFPPGGGH